MASTDLVGTIGRYEVERVLGQGGMGRVLLARDPVLGRHVAIKLLRDDLGIPPESRDALFVRMRHEARAAAALSHPGMVTLHDMGEAPDLGLYLVLEYVEGPTLRARIEEGPLPFSEVARFARQLGDALTAAHEAGVIHRDVKPENVLLSRTGPKLTDFGIARLPDSTLTGTGAVLGTPAYTAPEGLAKAAFGPASDQFSLAVTLYEALTGLRAFRGDDALVVAHQIATASPSPVAEHVAAGWATTARGVDAVLARGFHKDPKARFPSCSAFGAALAAALEAPMPGGPVPSERPRSAEGRKGQNLLVGMAVVLLVVLFMVGRRGGPEGGASLREAASAFASEVDAGSGAKVPVVSPRPRPRPPTGALPPGASASALPPLPAPEERPGEGPSDGAATGPVTAGDAGNSFE